MPTEFQKKTIACTTDEGTVTVHLVACDWFKEEYLQILTSLGGCDLAYLRQYSEVDRACYYYSIPMRREAKGGLHESIKQSIALGLKPSPHYHLCGQFEDSPDMYTTIPGYERRAINAGISPKDPKYLYHEEFYSQLGYGGFESATPSDLDMAYFLASVQDIAHFWMFGMQRQEYLNRGGKLPTDVVVVIFIPTSVYESELKAFAHLA